MYIYDRLIILGQLPGANHTNAMIARWLLAHLSTLSDMDEMQCMKEACVSKASIHRFYSCAGFHSFAQMISSLQKEKQTFLTLMDLIISMRMNQNALIIKRKERQL